MKPICGHRQLADLALLADSAVQFPTIKLLAMTFIIGLYFIPSAALTLCTGRRRRTLMVDPVSGAELDLADKILPSKATERSGTYPLYWPLIPGLTNMQLIRLQSLSSLLVSDTK